MKTLVTYYSGTGNTKRLAEAIYGAIPGEKEIMALGDVRSTEGFVYVLAGSYVADWQMKDELLDFLKTLDGKRVGLFATMTYWPDSDGARSAINAAAQLVKGKNKIIGKYICQGENPVWEHIIAIEGDRVSPELRRRFRAAVGHPTAAELEVGATLFAQRLEADVRDAEI